MSSACCRPTRTHLTRASPSTVTVDETSPYALLLLLRVLGILRRHDRVEHGLDLGRGPLLLLGLGRRFRIQLRGVGLLLGALAVLLPLLQEFLEREPVWKSKFYGAFVLNRRVVLHAIDATPVRWRGDAGSSPLDRARTAASSPRNDLVKYCRVHPKHWLIFTQVVSQETHTYMSAIGVVITGGAADEKAHLGTVGGAQLAEVCACVEINQ